MTVSAAPTFMETSAVKTRKRLLLLGVFANALVLLTIAIAAVATPDPLAHRGMLAFVAALAMALVPVDVALGWVLCEAPAPRSQEHGASV